MREAIWTVVGFLVPILILAALLVVVVAAVAQ